MNIVITIASKDMTPRNVLNSKSSSKILLMMGELRLKEEHPLNIPN